MMRNCILFLLLLFIGSATMAQEAVKIKKKDRKRDVEMVTTQGTIIIRLSDSTPGHRDNFLRLVKTHYYDSTLFHRVIKNFMIQGGDPATVSALPHQPVGTSGPDYTVPAEINPILFHKKGALAAARQSDAQNPERRSSGSQFYIVHGRTFTDSEMDSIERVRLQGRKIDPDRRQYYKTIGGTPQLDGNYTVFGQVVKGQEVVDSIAVTPTSAGPDKDRPIMDVRILSMRLIKRNKKI